MKTDVYIAAHGRWQLSRGRKPSETYHPGENPGLIYKEARASVEDGLSTMHRREGSADWADYIARSVLALGGSRTVNFAGVMIPVRSGDSPEKILEMYHAKKKEVPCQSEC